MAHIRCNLMSSKILLWDIECTHLKSDFGTLLCIGYKWLGEKGINVLSITDYPRFDRDPTDDSELVRDFVKVYSEAEMSITYNGARFDLPYLNGKILEHGLALPAPVPMLDVYLGIVRGKLAISRKSLQNVAYYLKLSAEKTPVEGRIWKRAATGHRGSIRYIIKHCKADVILLEEAYMKLRGLMVGHPRVKGWGPCRYCGEASLQSRGYSLTSQKARKQRFACMKCGCWETRPVSA